MDAGTQVQLDVVHRTLVNVSVVCFVFHSSAHLKPTVLVHHSVCYPPIQPGWELHHGMKCPAGQNRVSLNRISGNNRWVMWFLEINMVYCTYNFSLPGDSKGTSCGKHERQDENCDVMMNNYGL